MTLPELPKQNKKIEADFGVYLKNWLKKNPLPDSCTIELKQTRTNSFPFSDVKNKQIAYAVKAKSDEGVLIRIQGTDGQPDYAYFRNAPVSYIIIRYPKQFSLIDVDAFVHERDNCDRKSLTAARADLIGIMTYKIWG